LTVVSADKENICPSARTEEYIFRLPQRILNNNLFHLSSVEEREKILKKLLVY